MYKPSRCIYSSWGGETIGFYYTLVWVGGGIYFTACGKKLFFRLIVVDLIDFYLFPGCRGRTGSVQVEWGTEPYGWMSVNVRLHLLERKENNLAWTNGSRWAFFLLFAVWTDADQKWLDIKYQPLEPAQPSSLLFSDTAVWRRIHSGWRRIF